MRAIKVLKTLKFGKVHYSTGKYDVEEPHDLLDELEAGSEFVEEIKIQKSDLSQEDSPKQSEPVAASPEPEKKPEPQPSLQKTKTVLNKTKKTAKVKSQSKAIDNKAKKTVKTKKALKKGK